MKEHLQQVSFQWSYSHEDSLHGELSQQKVLVKSHIPTLDKMSQIDKEADLKRTLELKHKVSSERVNIVKIEDEESSSSSSMSLYNIESNRKDLEASSRRSPTSVEAQVPNEPEEVHSSPTTDKNRSERHSQVR